MDTLAIIPVKPFIAAKSRLGLDESKRKDVCSIMLGEVLAALRDSTVAESLVVTGDPQVTEIASQYGASVLNENHQTGVNDAVLLGLERAKGRTTIVLPQDIPLVESKDIDAILEAAPCPGALVVPSRKLDGTNALVRTPPDVFETRYDEGSYQSHIDAAQKAGVRATLAFSKNLMIDVDTMEDLRYVIASKSKPEIVKSLAKAID